MAKTKLNLVLSAASNKAVIKISGSISGWKNSSDEFEASVQKLIDNGVKDCDVYLNTGGGSVFEANEIANIIKRFKGTITGTVGALCASAGTVILVACKIRKGSKNSQYMIHKPAVGTFGNEDDHQSSLKLLQNIQETILDDYEAATKLKRSEIIKLWQKDYWMTAKEALAKGFITEVLDDNIQVENSIIDELIDSIDLENVPASVMMNLHEFKKETNILNSITNKTKQNGMEIKLVASLLNLPADKQDESSITMEIQNMVQENASLKAENKKLKDEETSRTKKAAETLIDDAIKANKLKAAERDEYVQHAVNNYELTRKLVEAKQPYKSAAATVEKNEVKESGGADVYANWTYEKLWKEAPSELTRIKNEEPDRFKKLFDAYTKRS